LVAISWSGGSGRARSLDEHTRTHPAAGLRRGSAPKAAAEMLRVDLHASEPSAGEYRAGRVRATGSHSGRDPTLQRTAAPARRRSELVEGPPADGCVSHAADTGCDPRSVTVTSLHRWGSTATQHSGQAGVARMQPILTRPSCWRNVGCPDCPRWRATVTITLEQEVANPCEDQRLSNQITRTACPAGSGTSSFWV
jgi:hypothetical protein